MKKNLPDGWQKFKENLEYRLPLKNKAKIENSIAALEAFLENPSIINNIATNI